ncbi:MAG TPA: tetratricopeptide repeat protein [Longimicrobiales bacterium]|nr:tetratricopeptide repeat protein [Longimicrobiales bacterium]
MKTPAPADLHRWSEELARNPGSLAFLPLARAYRRMGRRDLALQLCLRGLEHHPTHVEAHALLALLYFEAGERARAADEWATVLRLKPGNFEALRGMGFRHLEQGDMGKARQHLERAALIRPDDATVQEALRLIRHRESAPAPGPPVPHSPERRAVQRAAPVAPPVQQRQATTPPTVPAARPASRAPNLPPAARAQPRIEPAARPQPRFEPAWWVEPDAPAAVAPPAPAARRSPEPAAAPPDPTTLFESLLGAGPLLGVLLLDRRGLILAGGLRERDASTAEELGANLGGAIDEAIRAVTHLELGTWRGLTLEAKRAVLQIRPVGAGALVVVVAERSAPAGWIVRAADHAAALADRFVEVYS